MCSSQQLQQITAKIFKPYIDQKLSVWINSKKLPVMVGKLTKNGYLYDLALSIVNIGPALKKSGNILKIDYQLFFKETDGVHINLATITAANKIHNEIQNEFTGRYDLGRTD